MIVAQGTVEMVTAGKIQHFQEVKPEGGSHPSPTENSKMSIMPSQKLGMDMPTIDPTRARLSHRVSLFCR